MREIKLDKKNRLETLHLALETVSKGGIIVYPTETSYGLGADFFNAQAVGKIYEIKHRKKSNPLPVLVPDITYAATLVDFPARARRVVTEYWPGPLTLVLPFRYSEWHEYHCSDFLALRVSSQPFASDLLKQLGHPLVSTSANMSGDGDSYKARDIRAAFSGQMIQPDLFINIGDLPLRKATTIVKFDASGQMEVLRQGDIKLN